MIQALNLGTNLSFEHLSFPIGSDVDGGVWVGLAQDRDVLVDQALGLHDVHVEHTGLKTV